MGRPDTENGRLSEMDFPSSKTQLMTLHSSSLNELRTMVLVVGMYQHFFFLSSTFVMPKAHIYQLLGAAIASGGGQDTSQELPAHPCGQKQLFQLCTVVQCTSTSTRFSLAAVG